MRSFCRNDTIIECLLTDSSIYANIHITVGGKRPLNILPEGKWNDLDKRW